MRKPSLFGLTRLWDALLETCASRLSRLRASERPRRRTAARPALGLLPLEDRVVPARPLPLPFLFVGVGSGSPPEVKAYDAETGDLLYTRTPFDSGFSGGVRVAAGDVDRDGLPDLIAAAGPGGGPQVKVYSGADGELIDGSLGSFWAYDSGFTGGVYVASADVDGDGWADLLTAAGAGGGPHIKVFSGQSGQLLHSFMAFDTSFSGGATIAAADVTGDGKAELIVGAGAGGGPHVKVFDLNDGSEPVEVYGIMAFDSGFTGGADVGSDGLAGDVTGDGIADIVVGAGPGGGPHVKVFDGVDGQEVASFLAFDSTMTAGVRVATAFVDDDEFADVIVGTGSGVAATVRVFDGETQAELAGPMSPYVPFGSTFTGGLYVAGSNDPDQSKVAYVSGGSAPSGGTFELTVKVTDNSPANGLQSPSGTVSFSTTISGVPTAIGSATLSPFTHGEARATLQVNPVTWPAGTYFVTANYDGDFWFLSSSVGISSFISSPSTLSSPAIGERAYTGGGGGIVASSPGAGWTGSPAQAGAARDDGSVSVSLYGGVGGSLGTSAAAGLDLGRLSYTNASGYADSLVKTGGGVTANSQPRLTQQSSGTKIAMIDGAGSALWFNAAGGGSYTTPFGHTAVLVQNSTTGELELTDGAGSTLYFYDFGVGTPTGRAGRIKKRTDAAGNVAEFTAWDGSGRPTEVQITDPTGAVEALTSTYDGSGYLTTLTRKRKPSGGSFATVRTAEFTYATVTGATDKALVKTIEKDAGGTVLDETYNRYYPSGASTGFAGGLKYALGAQATARLKEAYSGSSLDSLTDAQVAEYADVALEYNSTSKRATKVVTAGAGCSACSGGQGTSANAYAVKASPGTGINDWTAKVAETLDDGTVRVSYANKFGQTLLAITTEAGNAKSWYSYTRYDSVGRVILEAGPSAVTGYSEALSDLIGYTGPGATYLRASEGQIATTTYATSTTATTSVAGDVAGFVKNTFVQKGTSGTPIKQSETTYIARTANGQTRYHTAAQTQYRNADGTGGQTATTAYTWQGSTHRIASTTTTLPTVTTAQNGPNSATTSTTVYDSLGRAIWSKDAAGVLSYTAYDAATGAVVKSIADVNTANTSDFANLPSGWTTPSGAGKHLISTSEVDALGRTTKSVDPLGSIAYTVYNDVTKEVRTYSGWNTSTNLPTGPTSVSRTDQARGYSESLTMSATPTVSSGRPTGAEAISGVQSLSRSYRNAAGQTTHSDDYFNLTGLTYSTSATLGTEGTHYYRTQMAYDKQGRSNKQVSAAGTITRTEFDALGRTASTWVGTDDVPTTGFWSPTNLAGTNMVKVGEVEYDGGGVGDSNATKQTQYPGGGAAARVTQTWYDWRNRAVATKSGVEASEGTSVNRPLSYTEYDNLGQTLVSELYDGDAVTPVDAGGDGVPDRPTGTLLRAKSVSTYDELGRAYKTETYSVDPSTGSVSTSALTSQSWFDLRGLTLKSTAPGGPVQKTAYDSLGRATTSYVSDGGGDAGWSDADDVVGDTVLSQSETTYDAAGNAILSVARERFHDATGTGALGTPTTGILSRVSYSASYFDLGHRLTDSVTVGTNGGTAYTRPGTVPARSDTVLVSSVQYDSAGRQWKTIDPKGIESRTTYDAAGRTTKTIENYVDGTVSDTDDKTTEYTYSAAGMTSLTAKLTGGSGQTTEWVYGVTTADSGLSSNDIVSKTKWPDPTTGAASASQQETVLVNALGQPLVATDRNGNTHTLSYDILGRVVSDAVTTLGSGVDGALRRVETAYDSQGNAYLLTNYDAASAGNIVNQVQRTYDGLGQLVTEYQSHGGAVNTGSTPKVQYAYSTLDSNNRSRLTSVTYPNGRVITYNYATGLDSTISRLSSISDGGTTLESYSYLGTGSVVSRAHPQPSVDLSYIKVSGESNGDAGDQYTGLDRFGRIVDQRWRTGSTNKDRLTYTYDRNGNRTAKTNSLSSSYSEVYTYDSLNQLSSFNRNSGARTQSWDYDALGNWDSVTTNGTAQTRTANRQNEITSVSGATTPTYDANGNMTKDETGKQFTFDAWNRLKVVKDSGGTTLKTYGYDALNRRVTETVGGTTTDLYYSSGWQVLEERVGGTARVSYVWSPVYVDAMIARDRDSDANGSLEERLYALHDANFNMTGLVNTSGTVVERYAYDPFGAVTVMNGSWGTISSSAYDWRHLHQGGRLDSSSGFYHFRNRDYSPTLGRWASMDPIGYEGGTSNIYSYVGGSPANNIDPQGLSGEKATCGPDITKWLLREMLLFKPLAQDIAMKKLEKPITTVAIMGRGRGHSHTTNPELEALKMFAELVRYTDYKSRVGEDAIDFSDCPFANKSTVSFFGVCIPINQVGNIMYGYIAKYADFADEAREYGFRGFRALSIKFPGIGAKIHIDIGGPDDSWINSRYKEAGFDWGIKLNEHMTKFWESITPYFENDRTDESMIDRMMTAIIWDNSDKVPGAVWYKSNKDAQKGIIDLPSCGVSYNGKNTDFKRVPGVQIDGNKFK